MRNSIYLLLVLFSISTAYSQDGCTDVNACNYNPDATVDDGSCMFYDCTGECGGSTLVDECGECGGDGIDEGACDCDGNIIDCTGECGGPAELDPCGVCGGSGIDSDNDGYCDSQDNCPQDVNNDQADNDGDSIGDVCDDCIYDSGNDSDGDGLCANDDNCPDDYNPDQEDYDGDAFGDVCDLCPTSMYNDSDNDGICNDVDNCIDIANFDQADSDEDGNGDACDTCPYDPFNDQDGDGVCANDEIAGCQDSNACNFNEAATDPIGEYYDPDYGGMLDSGCDYLWDADGDGLFDDAYYCNYCSGETDGTGVIMADNNTDGDLLCDDCSLVTHPPFEMNCDWGYFDNCPNDPENDIDMDGVCGDVDYCPYDTDTDEDGICDNVDNCDFIASNDQADMDGDGYGDICDNDANGDGYHDGDIQVLQEIIDLNNITLESSWRRDIGYYPSPDLDENLNGVIEPLELNSQEWEYHDDANRLDYLNLYGYNIKEIPESIGSLTHINHIYFNNLQLSTLPETILNLSNLNTLYLSNNHFTELPDWFEQLYPLLPITYVNLSSNSLFCEDGSFNADLIPEYLWDWDYVNIINEYNFDRKNQFCDTFVDENDDGFHDGHLTFIEDLIADNDVYLENCNYHNDDEEISIWDIALSLLGDQQSDPFSSGRIKYLNHNENDDPSEECLSITSIPESIGNVKSLQTLFLRNTTLTSLPEGLGNSKILYNLNIEDNHFTSLPSSFANMDTRSLTYVYLDDNNLYCQNQNQDLALIPQWLLDWETAEEQGEWGTSSDFRGLYDQNCYAAGCTDPSAINFGASFLVDDGSCVYDSYIGIENMNVYPEASHTVSIQLDLGEGNVVSAVQFQLHDTPNNLTCTGADVADVDVASDFYIIFNDHDGVCDLVLFSSNGNLFGGESNIIDLHFEVDQDAVLGDTINLAFMEIVASSPGGSELGLTPENGFFQIGALGDINADALVNIQDVVMVANFIVAIAEPTEYQLWAADVDLDGDNDVVDLMRIVNCIMGNCAFGLSREEYSIAQVRVLSESIDIDFDGEIAGIEITMTDAVIPALTSRSAGMELVYNGNKILLYSANGITIAPGSGPVLEFTGTGTIEDIVIASSDGGEVYSNVQAVPQEFRLYGAYPNPFNPTTTLSFDMPNAADVSLTIYNLTGRKVETLVNSNLEAGYHSVVWNADSHTSGIYFVKMISGENTFTQKIMLVK